MKPLILALLPLCAFGSVACGQVVARGPATCVALVGYSLVSGAEATATLPNGQLVSGAYPSGNPDVAPDVQTGGRSMLLATPGRGGAWDVQGLMLTAPPRGRIAAALRSDAAVRGCLVPGGWFLVQSARPISDAPGSTDLVPELAGVAAGVELVSPDPAHAGEPLLALLQRGTYADAIAQRALEKGPGYSPMDFLAVPVGAGRVFPLQLTEHWQDPGHSAWLFLLPRSISPGTYAVVLGQGGSVNGMPSTQIVFKVAP